MSSNTNSAPDSGIERETIPLIPDYEKSKIKLIDLKYTIGTSNFKAQLPSFSEGTAEEFLNFQTQQQLTIKSHTCNAYEKQTNLLCRNSGIASSE